MEDENEVQRLERFFSIDGVSEADYVAEWTAKEEALSQIMEKLLKSSRFMSALARGLEEEGEAVPESTQASWSPSRNKTAQAVEAVALEIEVSYVLPPAPGTDDEDGDLSATTGLVIQGGPRLWEPRLVIAHRSGALALLVLALEHVAKGKDRSEKWTCTQLRAELLTGPGGVSMGEPLCDLVGQAPHGVRYMRI